LDALPLTARQPQLCADMGKQNSGFPMCQSSLILCFLQRPKHLYDKRVRVKPHGGGLRGARATHKTYRSRCEAPCVHERLKCCIYHCMPRNENPSQRLAMTLYTMPTNDWFSNLSRFVLGVKEHLDISDSIRDPTNY